MAAVAALGMALEASPQTVARLSRIVIVEPPAAGLWAERLQTLDEAIAARSLSRATYEWREAYGAALGTMKWQPLADVADRALVIDAMAGGRTRYPDEAERIYRFALARARAAQATEGIEHLTATLATTHAAR
ncbi:MAG: hypothetical protein FJZ38_03565 [Candidatus Rokubacteria bacterium]|nr:hypothetical protein [Candidatus Rokubacteria bacterium]